MSHLTTLRVMYVFVIHTYNYGIILNDFFPYIIDRTKDPFVSREKVTNALLFAHLHPTRKAISLLWEPWLMMLGNWKRVVHTSFLSLSNLSERSIILHLKGRTAMKQWLRILHTFCLSLFYCFSCCNMIFPALLLRQSWRGLMIEWLLTKNS